MSDVISIDYGVLPVGFVRMRLPEIRQAIIDSLQAKTQLTFETRPDSITGQFIDVFAERETVIWELAQAVYHAMYPISAFGVNLDHAVSFAGVTRLWALQSLCFVNFYGNQGVTVPAGTVVRSETSREDFVLQDDVTIDVAAVGDATVSVNTATVGSVYTVTLTSAGNIVTASYTAIFADTNVMIAGHLAPLLVSANYTVVQDANTIRIYRIDGLDFHVTFSAGITAIKLGGTGMVKAVNYGPIEIPINSITQIVTTLTGLDSVDNVTPGQSGRETETDDLLRQRYRLGVYRLGAATLESIKANLEQNILGLLSVAVYENKSDVTDSNGRSPHSIEVVAYGGEPQSIGDQIFRTKAAGIDTFGSTVVSVTDSSGYTHVINFNRPNPIFVWVRVTVVKYSEELFPSNADELIEQIVTDTGNTFGVGKDIIVQRFLGPIYSQIPGIGQISIQTALTSEPDSPPGAYSLLNVPIAVRELSRFAIDRVTVIIT